MDKKFFKKCIQQEVLATYQKAKGRLTLFDRYWCKHLSPETNAVYLMRKKQYYESRGGVYRFFARFCHIKLMRRYGIHLTEGTTIGLGLRVAHPSSIQITLCNIGENFTIYQNCTIGQKKPNSGLFPTIGNNVTMFAGSMIIGKVLVGDNVVLGANSTLIHDASEAGVYIGSPAKLLKREN